MSRHSGAVSWLRRLPLPVMARPGRLGALAVMTAVAALSGCAVWRDPVPADVREIASRIGQEGRLVASGAFATGHGESICAVEPDFSGAVDVLSPGAADRPGAASVDMGRIHPLDRDVTQGKLGSAFCPRHSGNIFYRFSYRPNARGLPYIVRFVAWQDAPYRDAPPRAVAAGSLTYQDAGALAARIGEQSEIGKIARGAARFAAIHDNRRLSDEFGIVLGLIPRKMVTAKPSSAVYPSAARPRNSVASWVTTNDYPAQALRERREGTVGYRLAIGPYGRSEGCAVTLSSGSPDLDRMTCDTLVRRARFKPALDDGGNPVAGTWSGKVRWRIPE